MITALRKKSIISCFGRLLASKQKPLHSHHLFRQFTSKHLVRSKISQSVLNAQYAVRGMHKISHPHIPKPTFSLTLNFYSGAIVIRAGEIQNDLKNSTGNYPFDQVIMCNIGNPQELGQKPLTFHRQVLSSLLSPSLMETNAFPNDVKERATRILNDTPSASIGAYTHSQGTHSYPRTPPHSNHTK